MLRWHHVLGHKLARTRLGRTKLSSQIRSYLRYSLVSRCRRAAHRARPDRPTTLRSGDGFRATSWNSSRGCAVISSRPTNPGVSMRPMFGSRAAGATCIAPSIPQAPPSISSCQRYEMVRRPTAVPQGSQRSIASAALRHQHRSGTPLRLGDPRGERGRTLRRRCQHRPVHYLNNTLE